MDQVWRKCKWVAMNPRAAIDAAAILEAARDAPRQHLIAPGVPAQPQFANTSASKRSMTESGTCFSGRCGSADGFHDQLDRFQAKGPLRILAVAHPDKALAVLGEELLRAVLARG